MMQVSVYVLLTHCSIICKCVETTGQSAVILLIDVCLLTSVELVGERKTASSSSLQFLGRSTSSSTVFRRNRIGWRLLAFLLHPGSGLFQSRLADEVENWTWDSTAEFNVAGIEDT